MRGEFDSCFSGDFTSAGGVFISGAGGGGWGLGDNSIGFWDFSDVTLFSGILSLKSFGNLRGNSYISSANY